MVSVASAFQADGGERDLLRSEDKLRYQRLFEAQAARSYLVLSAGMGLIAALLPIVLVIAGGYQTHDSMSSFYHDKVGPTRDILVGSLCAVGAFLFLFHGLSKLENWLLNLAGIAIILVAVIPSPGDTGYGSAPLHRGFAIVFFVLIGIVAIFLSKGRVKNIVSERKKRWFMRAYNFVGVMMIAAPIAATALQYTRIPIFTGHAVLLAEVTGIWSFAAYWFVKTREYRMLLRIRWTA
jgi:hypothetical protein